MPAKCRQSAGNPMAFFGQCHGIKCQGLSHSRSTPWHLRRLHVQPLQRCTRGSIIKEGDFDASGFWLLTRAPTTFDGGLRVAVARVGAPRLYGVIQRYAWGPRAVWGARAGAEHEPAGRRGRARQLHLTCPFGIMGQLLRARRLMCWTLGPQYANVVAFSRAVGVSSPRLGRETTAKRWSIWV